MLKTTFADVRLYNGRGKGFVTFDGTGNEAALASQLRAVRHRRPVRC